MLKKYKILNNFFIKDYKMDINESLLQKQKFHQRQTRRIIKFFKFETLKKIKVFRRKLKKKQKLKKKNINILKRWAYTNLKKYNEFKVDELQLSLFLNSVTKSNLLSNLFLSSFYYKNKSFFKKKTSLMFTSKNKIFFLNLILNCYTKVFKKNKNFFLFSKSNNLIMKKFYYRRIATFIWRLDNAAYYKFNRRQPWIVAKPLNINKIWLKEWWLQKFFITYYGFFCKRKFFFFKRKNKFFKKHSLERVYFLESLLISLILRLNLFSSYRHILNLIKIGGVTVNRKTIYNPYHYVKMHQKISFKPSLKNLILKVYLNRLLNKQVCSPFPNYFIFDLPSLTFLRWRNPNKEELLIITSTTQTLPLYWI